MAKYLDDNGLLYFWSKIKSAFVEKESGKGLSTNDYTTAEKTKLSGVATGAQVNVIETVKKNGTALTITSKAVDISVPTAISDLTNDSDFVTDSSYVHTDNNFTTALKNKLDGIAAGATVDDHKWNNVALNKTSNTTGSYVPGLSSTSATTAYLLPIGGAKGLAAFDSNGRLSSVTPTAGDNTTLVATTAFVTTAITNAISSIQGISYEVVQTLPATGSPGVIYLVSNSGTSPNVYDEYIWVNNAFEKIGTTAVDLSGYWAKADLVAITNAEIDTIVAN